MARRLFFVPEVRREAAEIEGEHAQHLVRVLRVEEGQIFEITDGHGLFLAEVESARKSSVRFRVTEKLEAPPPPPDVTLAASLIKFDHFEWLLEKATELNVARIVPIVAERSERGLEQAAGKRSARWHRILIEACQQARRIHVPELEPALVLEEFLPRAFRSKLFLEERRSGLLLPESVRPGGLALLLGPEGGWADREREAALAAGWTPVSLGPNILRAETAGIAALAIVSVMGALTRPSVTA